MHITRRAMLGAFATVAATGTQAQPWTPTRPLKLVVPYAPGGVTDQLGRAIADRLSRALGQPVVVENRQGANAMVGTMAVVQSEPDGYTLLMASGASMVFNPLLYRRLAYDPDRDLQLLAAMVETPLVMVVHPSLPVATVADFVAHARRHPDALNYASVGLGNPVQLAAEMFRMAAGIEMTHVPYNGSAPALTALVAGDVQVMFDPVLTSLPFIRSARLRALAVTTRERVAALPDVPTVAESGYRDYEATTWFGVAVPRATPQPIAERLRNALQAVQEDAEFRTRFGTLGLAIMPPRNAEGVAAYLAAERARWGGVIRARNITLD